LYFVYVQELVSKGKYHNWRNVAAFVAVGIVVLVLVIVGIVFLARGSANDKQADAVTSARTQRTRSSITLEDVVEGKFSPRGFNGTWISGESEDIEIGTS
jgi:L-asparagine transporter-like permease